MSGGADLDEFNCQKCDKADSHGDMVQCDSCKTWYHFECVNVTSDIKNNNWDCDNCKTQTNYRPKSKTNSRSSNNEKLSNRLGRTKKMLALELEKLEAQREVEKDYIERRFSLMQKSIIQTYSDDENDSLESEGDIDNTDGIQNWINSNSNLVANQHIINQHVTSANHNMNAETDVSNQHAATDISNHNGATNTFNNNVTTTTNSQPIITSHSNTYSLNMQQAPTQFYQQSHAVPEVNMFPTTSQIFTTQPTGFYTTATINGNNNSRPVFRNSYQNMQQHPVSMPGMYNYSMIPPQIYAYGNNQYIPQNRMYCPTYYDTNSLPRQNENIKNQPSTNKINTEKINILKNDERLSCDDTLQLSSLKLASRQALPKDLPNFNGQPEDWPLFISRFENTTRMCGFSNDENLIRLQKCLKGEALESVKCRLLLPSNVPGIIDTLRWLYGRPQIIIQTLIQKIKSEPPPKIEKLESLTKFALSVENLCATMEASNLSNYFNNPILLQEIVDKLPPQLKINWASYISNIENITISTFSSWLVELARNLSQVIINIPKPAYENKRDEKPNKSKHFVHTHTETESKNENDNTRCPICNKNCTTVQKCKKFHDFNLNEKWKAVKQIGLCRTCLLKHKDPKCKFIKKCGKDGCEFKHHPLLHKDKKEQNETNTRSECDANQFSCTHQFKNQTILYRIVPVILYSQTNKINTFAFVDEGSSLTLIEHGLADELNLNGQLQPLCLRWTANTQRFEKNSQLVNFKISSINSNNKKYSITNAHTVRSLDLPSQTISADALTNKYKYLKDIPINSYEDAVPRILIGLDNSNLGASLKIKEGNDNEPIAVKTRLGWNVYGSLKKNATSEQVYGNYHICGCDNTNNEELQQIVKDYISLDNLGVTKPNQTLISKDDERALQIMKSTANKIGNKYEIGLLWKYDTVLFPDSLPMAKKRFECLEKKMIREPKLANILKDKIKEHQEKGYIHKLSKIELSAVHSRIWYLPIFTVTNPNKPGKVRMVWDAAAKVNGVSMNSMLLKGPDQLTSLPAVLNHFRERKYAICADIREMFHQVLVKDEDRHSQRFLWRENVNEELEVYMMDVMTFGASCSPSCAQYIKNENAKNYKDQYPRAVTAIIENHYMDDLLDSMDSEDEVIQLAKDVKFIHQQGGFEIRDWLSNSKKVQQVLGGKNNDKDLNVDPDNISEKVLGMWWSTSSDSFSYPIKYNKLNEDILKGNRRPTKREVLRILMRIYDPLGLIANFLIYLKILLQDIWKSSIDWDDEINDDQFKKWMLWIKMLPKIEIVKIQRCYINEPNINKDKVQLHIFVDASDKAYAAVAYFRFGENENIECSLIGAKTRVAPLKMLSIPRLELQAAILGTRLASSIKSAHSISINERYFWTDSKTVVSWINSDQRTFRQFVAFRIGEILETTEVNEWRWLPSKQNVADEATKWSSKFDLQSSGRWFTGPEFLRLPKDQWPQNILPLVPTEEELKPHEQHQHHAMVMANLINVERFSQWSRLVRAVAYVYRFSNNISSKIKGTKKNLGPITQPEYNQAENYFSIYKKSPYLDENGILRVKGRIDAAIGISAFTKRPVILPRRHQITSLIIRACHKKYHHHNHETVVNEMRQKYSISRLRAAVKNEYKNCQLCKNKNSSPRPPEMGELPYARLQSFTRPFSYVGIDYFGPMQITIGRRTEKRWGVLLTCLTTRAVHIEVVHSLTSDSCILSLRNFISRRGIPLEFYSDNSTTFHGTEKELESAVKQLDQKLMAIEFTSSTTKWKFIPPLSPHMGGSWERLIQSVKKTLYQIMPTRNPTDELLQSMLIEVENIINSRPLIYVPIEDEGDEALTPNHFLLGSSNGMKPLGEFSDDSRVLKKNWMKAQRFANAFWKRWVREYLPTLTQRSKWFHPVPPIKKDDIVIVIDEKGPRNTWPKGIVLDVNTSKDGQVRSATVQTATGIYVRPTVKLAVLDVRSNNLGKPIDDTIAIPGGSVTASDGHDK